MESHSCVGCYLLPISVGKCEVYINDEADILVMSTYLRVK